MLSVTVVKRTGLVWQDGSVPSTMTWQGAIDYCESLNFAGKNDWRLPNLNELTSLVDYTVSNPAINTIFVNTASAHYWSSTTFSIDSQKSWDVYFGNGSQEYFSKTDSLLYVRCVRAGR